MGGWQVSPFPVKGTTAGPLSTARDCSIVVSSLRRNIYPWMGVLHVGANENLSSQFPTNVWWSAGDPRKEMYEDVAKGRHRYPRRGGDRRNRPLQHKSSK